MGLGFRVLCLSLGSRGPQNCFKGVEHDRGLGARAGSGLYRLAEIVTFGCGAAYSF